MAKQLHRRQALKLGGLALTGTAIAAGAPSEALAAHCASGATAAGMGQPLSARLAAVLAMADRAAARARQAPPPDPSFQVLTRRPGLPPESPTEKPVVVPATADRDPGHHAWADAGFATDIMAEHAVFMAMLIPVGTAEDELGQALSFANRFLMLNQRVSSMPPPGRGELRPFVSSIVSELQPLIDFKFLVAEEQRTGRARTLIWPLFADHIRKEAERWSRRLTQLAGGQSELDRMEVLSFWVDIMEEHARFIAHLLDPDEFALIDKAMEFSKTGRELEANPAPAIQNPQMALGLVQEIIDFKTAGARGIETAQIKSIIDPRLADHVRREAVKFADELKRVV
jgi:hypothetical protein